MQKKRNQQDKVFEKLSFQSCALYVAGPSGPWHLTFASGQLENLSFPLEIVRWVPWISQVESTGFCLAFHTLSLRYENKRRQNLEFLGYVGS